MNSFDGWIINTPEQCREHKKVCKKVKDFLVNVSSAGEESITDYLLWQWREIDNSFNSIKVSDFTRFEENNKSGADFEMELWVLGPQSSFCIVFQAKKATKDYDGYLSKLRYPKNNKSQLNTLLHYARTNKKTAMYALYSIPDKNTKTMCEAHHASECGVFIAHAEKIKSIASLPKNTEFSKNRLLKISHPLNCLFCCNLETPCLRGLATPLLETTSSDETPEYVKYIDNCNGERVDKDKFMELAEGYDISIFRHVAVYNMRSNFARCLLEI